MRGLAGAVVLALLLASGLSGCTHPTPPQGSSYTPTTPLDAEGLRPPDLGCVVGEVVGEVPIEEGPAPQARLPCAGPFELLFDVDSDQIPPENDSLLQQLATCYHDDGEPVLLTGYADERGPVAYNLWLGQRRAGKVAQALLERHVLEQRLRTASEGEGAPLCSEPVEACWRRNRRVVVGPTRSFPR